MNRRNDHPYSMWAEACAMLDRAERLQRTFFRPAGLGEQPTWEPPADLFESDDALLILVALPGVRPQNVELLFNGAELIVTGARRLPAESAGLAVRRLEIPAGRFERRIPLPAGHFEIADRRFVDGCLSLVLRRL